MRHLYLVSLFLSIFILSTIGYASTLQDSLSYDQLPSFRAPVTLNYSAAINSNGQSSGNFGTGGNGGTGTGGTSDGTNGQMSGGDSAESNMTGSDTSRPIQGNSNRMGDADSNSESNSNYARAQVVNQPNYPYFDEDFSLPDGLNHREYFSKPLGAMTRQYIYDSIKYNSSKDNPYEFYNANEFKFIEVTIDNGSPYVNSNNLSFNEPVASRSKKILPTLSAADFIYQNTSNEEYVLYWNPAKQLILNSNKDIAVDLLLELRTSYNYYDELFDNFTLSDVQTKKIPIDETVQSKVNSFLTQSSDETLHNLVGSNNASHILETLLKYYKSFNNEPANMTFDPSLDIYERISLSHAGFCRQRAMSFFITANALGLPTRYVYNDVHAFVEVYVISNGEYRWKAFNLGGPLINASTTKSQDVSKSPSSSPAKSADVPVKPLANITRENETNLPKLNVSHFQNATENVIISEPLTSKMVNYLEKNWVTITAVIFVCTLLTTLLVILIRGRKKVKLPILKSKDERELKKLLKPILLENKDDERAIITKGYLEVARLVARELELNLDPDMTARELLAKVPDKYDTQTFEKIIDIYEKAYFGEEVASGDSEKFMFLVKRLAMKGDSN